MKPRLIVVLAVALVLSVGVAGASAGGGNSDAAKACQQGGWQHLYRTDGTGFKNEGDCVSYAARGGKLTTTTTTSKQSQLDCQAFGGTFAPGTAPVLWTCNGWVNTGLADFAAKDTTLLSDCLADGGTALPLGTLNIPGAIDATCEAD
jgi:hypothetical protein